MQKILEYCLPSLTCFPLNLTSYAKDNGILPFFLNLFFLKPNFVCKRYWNIAFLP